MNITATVSKWGNSKAIRLPIAVLEQANLDLDDRVLLTVDEDGRVILTKVSAPQKGTLEYLFKDYIGGSFQAKLAGLGEPTGNEKW